MALYNGSEKFSSQIGIAQYADVTDLMKHMTIEVGDVGQVMLPLNENENKRRYLNGQAILQEQFPKFTAKLKNAVSLYPSMACTEAQWQAKRLADPDDQCAKFVIDDVNGTIRLPRIKYLVGNLNLYNMGKGIPQRRLVKKYKSGTQWYNWYSDGWCEQGGTIVPTNKQIATFLIPYVDANYNIVATNAYGDTANRRWASAGTVSNTQYWVMSSSSSSGASTTKCYWRAEGYAKVPDTTQQYSQDIENQFESPYYIQVSTGVDYDIDVTRQITTNSPYSFGDSKYVDVDISNLSWLKSDGTWKDGTAYTDYYNWILTNANNSVAKFKLSTNAYTDYDWVVNTSERKFRLPLLNGSEVIPGNTSTNDINLIPIVTATGTKWIAPKNGYINGGCTGTAGSTFLEINNDTRKITGTASFNGGWGRTYTQVFAGDSVSFYYGGTNYAHKEILFRPAIGNGSLYYYVGETVQGANLINAGKLAESMAQLSALSTRYIVEKWESGNQFRILYNDGWCEQGGEVYVNGEVSVTVTYPKPYADNNYNLTLGWNSTADDRNNDCSNGNNKTPTGFIAYGKTSTGYMSWRAVGYMARG